MTHLAFEVAQSKSTKYSGPAGRNEPCPCGSGEKYKNVMGPDRSLNYVGRGLEMFRNGRELSPREHAWMLPTPCNRVLFIGISVDSLKFHRRAWGSIWPAKAGHIHLGGRKYMSVKHTIIALPFLNSYKYASEEEEVRQIHNLHHYVADAHPVILRAD
ncbi:TPA: SEC-C metal-binding domain-containing protein [Salmonella enterica subsp. diarizonae]